MTNHVICAFCNARSVRNKLRDINCLLTVENIDVLAVAESWLTENDPDYIFKILSHNIFRRDRNSKGGGLLLLVKKNIRIKQTLIDKNFEILCVDMYFGKKLVRYIVLYIPHPSSKILKQYLRQIKSLLNFSGICVIMGDFNIDYDLVVKSDLSKHDCESIMKKFITKNQPLFQFVFEPTRLNRAIDLVFSNSKTFVFNLQIKDPLGHSDHNLLIFKCLINKPKVQIVSTLAFSQSNYNDINKYISNLNILSIIKIGDPNISWSQFCNILKHIIDKFVPTFKFDPNCKIFINAKLKKLIIKKFKFWKKYKNTKSALALRKYRDIKNKIRQMLKDQEKFKLKRLFKSKPQDVYKYI